MNASILLVGDYAPLLLTRALILAEWHPTVTHSRTAALLVQNCAYDLIILCQTTPDRIAMRLVDLARSINAEIKVLAFKHNDQVRDLQAAAVYHPAAEHPLGIVWAVESILTVRPWITREVGDAPPPPTKIYG